jgi:hypothetical protein
MPDAPRYWPFPVLPPERRTAEHQAEIAFLETAYAEGFGPHKTMPTMCVATAPSGRTGSILFRGRTNSGSQRNEVLLTDSSHRVGACWVEGFEPAAEAVLAWLRGGDIRDIMTKLQPALIRGPGVINPGG